MTGNAGFTVVAPTFITVGSATEKFTFASIQGDFQFTDTLQFFDADGNVESQVVWCDDNVGVTPGWYAEDMATSLSDQEFPTGSGFFVSLVGSANIIISGQVSVLPTTSNVGFGFTVVGNNRPYDVLLGDFVFTGLQFTDTLQFFDADGNVESQIVWCDDNVGVTPGWYAEDMASPLASMVIHSAAAFFLSTSGDGGTVTLPALAL